MLRASLGWIKRARGRSLVISISIIICLGIIGLIYLSSTPSGLSSAEAAARTSSQSLHLIAHNPVNAPHKLFIYALHKLNFSGHGAMRTSSITFAAIFGLFFYLLASSWFGKSIGLLGALIFISTPIFIVAARQTSEEIMFLWPVVIMALYSWLLRAQTHTQKAWLCLIAAVGLGIYVPGVVWWLIGAIYISRAKLKVFISRLTNQFIGINATLLAVLITPLGIALVRNWHLVHSWLLIPAHWPHIFSLIKNLVWMFLALLARTPYHDNLIIGRLPILDLIQIALLVFGAYAMWTAAKNRAVTLAASIGFAIAVAAFNDNLDLLILSLPAIALFVTAGLKYLYIEWRSIFPTNPIPKSLALVLMVCLVAVHLAFGLSYSLIAWPHTLATRDSYVIK